MKTIVMLSAANKAELEEVINEFFYSKSYYIDDNMKLQNDSGKITADFLNGFVVKVTKQGRWQLRKNVEV